MKTLSFDSVAFEIGRHTTLTDTALAGIRQAYNAATPAQQKDLRHRWVINHISGASKGTMTVEKAREVFSLGKGKGAKPDNIKRIDRASSDFRYYVVTKTPKAAKPTKHNRISREARDAGAAYLAMFDNVADAIKALRSIAK